MLDEQQEAPEAEAEDAVDVADAGGDDAIDLAEMGTPVETADEPAVQPEELLEMPDAPERWEGGEPKDAGPAAASEARATEAADLGAQAAAEDAGEAGGQAEAEAEPPDESGGDEE